MERKRRAPLTFLDSESTVNSPFGSHSLTSDTFSFTFRSTSVKLPPLKPIQHRSARKFLSHNPLVSPREHVMSENMRSLLSLRRFAKTMLSDRDSKKELYR